MVYKKGLKGTEAGHKLKVYQQEAEAELGRILALWMQHAVDEKLGGFVGRMDNNGKVMQYAPKEGVLNARNLWSFSAAYRHTQEQACRAMADRAVCWRTCA